MNEAGLAPLNPRSFDLPAARHLLNRAGFGGSRREIEALLAMGLDHAVDHLVDFHRIDVAPVRGDEFDHDIVRPANAEERAEVREARRRGGEALLDRLRREVQARQRADRQQMAAIQRWWLDRMIRTPRPLEEKLTLFWHGHFACSYRTIEDSYHLFMQNDLFRRFAAGNFGQLCFAIIRDPAMLKFLNNDRNRRRAPNENLARELLELFTMGEGRGYTEADIREGARALTGYTFYDDDFVFRDEWHDSGRKRILGQVGRFDGDDFVRIVLSRREVSEFLAWKLYRHFVSDVPIGPEGLSDDARQCLNAMARLLRRHRYHLRPVLHALFRSRHFYEAAHQGSMIKSPVQLLVQHARAFGITEPDLDVMRRTLALMGQNIFYPPSVNGWDGGRSWINTSTIYVRQNALARMLLDGRNDGEDAPRQRRRDDAAGRINAMDLIEPARGGDGLLTPERAARFLLESLLATAVPEDRAHVLNRFVESRGGRLNRVVALGMVLLITTMPEYQLC